MYYPAQCLIVNNSENKVVTNIPVNIYPYTISGNDIKVIGKYGAASTFYSINGGTYRVYLNNDFYKEVTVSANEIIVEFQLNGSSTQNFAAIVKS